MHQVAIRKGAGSRAIILDDANNITSLGTLHLAPHPPNTMGNAQVAKAELPDDSDDARAGATTPGGGLKSRASPNGGVLFKFDVSSEKYEVAAPNVTPELTDDGDDEAPRWILEVSERSRDLNIRFLAPLNPARERRSSRGDANAPDPPSPFSDPDILAPPFLHRLATCRARYPTSAA